MVPTGYAGSRLEAASVCLSMMPWTSTRIFNATCTPSAMSSSAIMRHPAWTRPLLKRQTGAFNGTKPRRGHSTDSAYQFDILWKIYSVIGRGRTRHDFASENALMLVRMMRWRSAHKHTLRNCCQIYTSAAELSKCTSGCNGVNATFKSRC